jgi:hypothetical protein
MKQFLYGVFYLVFFAAIISGVYFLFIKPAPTCFDNIQNQGEQGIDCGGPCAKVCESQTKQISVVGSPTYFVLDKSHVGLLAQLSNPNSGYAAQSFAYEFSLYDSTGTLIQSFAGDSFIYAGEVKYILFPNVAVSSTDFGGNVSSSSTASSTNSGRVEFSVQNPDWVPASDLKGPPQLDISGVGVSVSGNTVNVSGQITNNDTISFSSVTIIALFHGKSGQLTGASETVLTNLAPGEKRTFSVVHPPIADVSTSAADVGVYAYTPRQ